MPLPSASLKPLLASIAAWIMTLDLGSNEINSAIAVDSCNTSIFINGNLARVLLASHRITGDEKHLAARASRNSSNDHELSSTAETF